MGNGKHSPPCCFPKRGFSALLSCTLQSLFPANNVVFLFHSHAGLRFSQFPSSALRFGDVVILSWPQCVIISVTWCAGGSPDMCLVRPWIHSGLTMILYWRSSYRKWMNGWMDWCITQYTFKGRKCKPV